jgi:hypothetical protein
MNIHADFAKQITAVFSDRLAVGGWHAMIMCEADVVTCLNGTGLTVDDLIVAGHARREPFGVYVSDEPLLAVLTVQEPEER